MQEIPETHPSLLVRMRNPQDRSAWETFVGQYGPLIQRFARKHGLQDADAADLTQVVSQEVVTAIQRLEYDPRCGTFRSWLLTIVQRHLWKFLARQKKRVSLVENGCLDEQPERSNLEENWEQEYRRHCFLRSVEAVKSDFETSSWQAFWQTAVEGRNATEVAHTLHMSIGAVYTARSRVLDRIRKQIQRWEVEMT